MRALWVAVALTLATGCVPTFDDNLSLISEPQVLAVQSEPAEAAPGDQVQLTELTASPNPNGAAPKVVWGLCVARKPLTELGPVNPDCIQAPSLDPEAIQSLGSGATVQATLPMDACRLFGPSLPEAMNGEPSGRPVDPDPTGGFYEPIGVTLPADSVTTLGAVRIFCPPSGLDQEQAIAFNTSYRRNENPVLDAIEQVGSAGTTSPVPVDPEVLSLTAGQAITFRATWAACTANAACSGAETYVLFNLDSRQLDTHHESIRVSWYATAGRFENAVTGRDEDEFTSTSTDNTWTAPSEKGDVRLWLVIRDARGGQSFRSLLATVK